MTQLHRGRHDRASDPSTRIHQQQPRPQRATGVVGCNDASSRGAIENMMSLQSTTLLPASAKPRLSAVGGGAVTSTATSRKRKRDGGDEGHEDNSRGEVVDGIELNLDAAPLPPEWQRCLDIKSGQIHYYNTRTHKRTWKDPRAEPEHRAAVRDPEEDEESSANCATFEGLDLELNLNLEPRRSSVKEKRPKLPAYHPRPAAAAAQEEDNREMVPAVCARCHMLVMMCRASPACPNCKFLHSPTPNRAALPPEPEALKLGLQLLCCRD